MNNNDNDVVIISIIKIIIILIVFSALAWLARRGPFSIPRTMSPGLAQWSRIPGRILCGRSLVRMSVQSVFLPKKEKLNNTIIAV